jgi:hypothetical protein
MTRPKGSIRNDYEFMSCAAYPDGSTMGTGYSDGWRWFGDGKQQRCDLN